MATRVPAQISEIFAESVKSVDGFRTGVIKVCRFSRRG
jgi:hypothetical protein